MIANELVIDYQLIIRQACMCLSLSRTTYYYQPKIKQDDKEIIGLLDDLTSNFPTRGFKKLFYLLRNKGYDWNKKKVYRIYKEIGLNLRRKKRRRLPKRERKSLLYTLHPNEIWSMDFMSDSLQDEVRFRTFNVVDDFNREILTIEIDTSISSARVINCLERAIEQW